ncbi:unnamed protein product, partial [Polarella glacialis]
GPHWREHLDLGRAPSWFLWRCLPVSRLLVRSREEGSVDATEPPSAKRARCSTADAVRQLLLSGLSECEHLVLLALFRQHDRAARAVRSLSTLLHELQQLVDRSGGVLSSYREDAFCAAFDRLLQTQLVRYCQSTGGSDVPKRYLPCQSLVDSIYAELVIDLERSEPNAASASNPLRTLPRDVQQWAVRQRV